MAAIGYRRGMTASWPERASLSTFAALGDDDRLALARRLAAALGDCTAHPHLIGTARLAAVRHDATGVVLVAIPGGTFTMGLRDDEHDEVRRVVFGADPAQRFAAQLGAYLVPRATPAHPVAVAPFLCATGFVDLDGRALDPDGGDEDPWLEDDDAAALAETLAGHGLRLLSEAEWEWVATEGGPRRWLVDVTGKHGLGLDADDAPANAWGIARLKSHHGELVADAWHDDYGGAPADARAWDAGPVPGVHRGSNGGWQDDAEALGCHVAFRAGGTGGPIRPARDLP